MNYEQQYLNEYRKFSNPSSSHYQKGYQGLLDMLNASSPTLSTYLGGDMAHGGSYKGSQVVANQKMRAARTQNSETARRGFLDMYMSGQALGMQALGGAAQAYQYEDSKPSFWEEIGGYALGGLTQGLMGGGGFLSGLFGGGGSPSSGPSVSSYGHNTPAPGAMGTNRGLMGGLGRTVVDPYNISQGGLR